LVKARGIRVDEKKKRIKELEERLK